MSKAALDKVVEHAKSRGQEEVVGILIGRGEGQTVIVEDAITGRIESTATRAVLPPETIAKIADDIIKQRIQGTIVGWYHSHPGYGIFMSNVDISTQTRLQQFSRYVTALIVDPLSDEVGFFTLDASGSPIAISPQRVHIFQEGEEPVPPEFEAPIEEPSIAPPVEEMIPPVIVSKRSKTTRNLVVVLLLVGIMLGGMFGTIFLLPDKTPAMIQSLGPTMEGWYGMPLNLTASVEVPSKNLFPARIATVKLHYRLSNESSYQIDEKKPSGTVYTWTIPGRRVIRDIEYHFSAMTTAGINATIGPYPIHVADFLLKVSREKMEIREIQVFVGKRETLLITVTPVRHFESPRVSLSAKALSGDLDFKWDSGGHVLSVPQNTMASAILLAEARTGSYGIHTVIVSAESQSITHRIFHDFTFRVIVPSFEVIPEQSTIRVSRTSTGAIKIAFRSLYGDIGNVTWRPPTLKGSTKPAPDLPYGVLPSFNESKVRWLILQKDKVKHIALSFSVSDYTPIGRYEIVLYVYADSCPECYKELIVILHVT